MDLLTLCSQQGTLFLLILIGLLLKKKGIITEEGKRCLTDLCITIIIPCNIIKSCLMEFNWQIMQACGLVFLVGFLVQIFCVFLNKFLFNTYPLTQKKVLQYCTIVSMGGFLGNPVAEGIYGNLGLLYTSIFLIPMRLVMWSVGTSYFINTTTDTKKVLHNVLTHPCLVSIYIGVFLMVSQIHLPHMLVATIKYVGNCNSAMTMFIIGTILADVNIFSIFNLTGIKYSILRLGILPAMAFGLCSLFKMDTVALGVSVLMTGMPAGATAAIFAARYDSDAPFATKLVVLTTLLSIITIPLWCYYIS